LLLTTLSPIVKFRTNRWKPFVEALFVERHSHFYGNLCSWFARMCCARTHPETMRLSIIGGGHRTSTGKPWNFGQFSWTTCDSFLAMPFTAANQQPEYSVSSGVVLRFGGAPRRCRIVRRQNLLATRPARMESSESVAIRARCQRPGQRSAYVCWTATGGAVDGTGSQVRGNPAGVALGAYQSRRSERWTREDGELRGGRKCDVEPDPIVRDEAFARRMPAWAAWMGRAHITAAASDPGRRS